MSRAVAGACAHALLAGAAVASAGPAAAAGAIDCFAEGTAAYRAGRYRAAIEAFSAMRKRAECQLDPLVSLNLARSAQAEVEQGGDPALACLAAREYSLFLRTRPDKALARVADDGRGAMADRCAAVPPPQVDRTWAWAWTGGAAAAVLGGVLLNVAARGSLADADAAVARQRAAQDPAAFTRASRAADDAYDAAEWQAGASYGVLGLGVALAGVATWAWLDADAPVNFAVGPTGLMGVVRW